MANWSNPTLTSTYTNFVSEVTGRDTDVALGMDPAVVTVTNPPTNAIRWTSASRKWQKWSGSAWGDLASSYAINVEGTLNAPAGSVGAPSMRFASSATTGFYAPAADRVALSIAGTQRLYVTGTGRFSFGAGTNPAAPVTVAGGGFAVQESGVNRALSFLDAAGTTTYGSFGYDSTSTNKDIFVSNGQSGGRVLLKIAGADKAVLTETELTMSAALVMGTGQQLRVGDGSVTAPAIAHSEGGNDTGIYFPGDGFINFASNGLLRFGIDDNGRIFGTALHNNAALPSGTTSQYIASGTYTPTLTASTGVLNNANLAGGLCTWVRTGNVVTVSGVISLEAFNAPSNGYYQVGVQLPIPSNVSASSSVSGIAVAVNSTDSGGRVFGDQINDRAYIQVLTVTNGVRSIQMFFSYFVE